MTSEHTKHRLSWKALAATVSLYRCKVCGVEPVVSLDEEHEPVLACRTHGPADVAERD